jgi:hypothetical protein
MLDDIFGENEVPIDEVYKIAQKVIKDYMDKQNKKIDYVAQELGTTPGYLRKQIDPNQSDRPLSIDRILSITRLTGDKRILERIALEFDMVLIPRTQATSSINEINTLVDMANIENGDVFREIKLAIADGIVDKEEQKRILKEIDEAQIANAKLKDRVLHMCSKDIE